MKKPLIAVAISMAFISGAQAESQFYGKMNVSLNYADADPELSLNSNASRLGVKGSDDLGNSKVIYQAEFELAVDDGLGTDKNDVVNTDTDTNTLKSRDTYIGLEYGNAGTVKMGLMDTPLKKSQGKFDLFNDVVDIKNVLDGEKRTANSINYTTPKIGAVQASVSYLLKEDDTKDDGISASVTYSQDAIYASVAVDSKTEDDDTSTVRATVIYNAGDLSFGALLNNVDASDTKDDELGFAVNAAMKMGVNTAKVQFESGDQNILGATSTTIGLDHKLAKTTKAFVYVNQFDHDAGDQLTVALGLEHKF
ncbi:MAG: putative porin [Oceanicoccus sp.]|jgi:predicted porin